MKVYFVRHGQTESNIEQRHQFPETPLSSHGLSQADAVAKRFQHLKVDLILSSTYSRAMQTAKAIGEITKVPLMTTDLLIERRHPSTIRGKLMSDPEVVELHRVLREHFHEKDWHHSDEENFHDVIKRSKEALDFIISQNKEHVVIVTHGYFLLLLISLVLFGDLIDPKSFTMFKNHTDYNNTGLTMCEYNAGEWKLLTFNDYAHLGE